MFLAELPTPALLIEWARLERNLRRMQDRAKDNNVVLRPHIKTHKCIEIARIQLAAGSPGITVAKPGEAQVFSDAGFSDIRIAFPIVTETGFECVARLANTARISFCVDTLEGARAASEYFVRNGSVAQVFVEVDCGHGRCGVPWNDPHSVDFVKSVSELTGLHIAGILTHAGHAYAGPQSPDIRMEDALQQVADEERDFMLAFAEKLHAAGLVPDPNSFEISIGSTPSISRFSNSRKGPFRITEIRPGNYVFHDAIQVALGAATLEDCALTVLSTVVSKHRHDGKERLFIDAGKKVLTTDTGFATKGYGTILYNAARMYPLPHATISNLSEEHGWVQVSGGSTLEVGDRVRVVPNHACVVANMVDHYYLVDGDEVIDTWKVDARGMVV